MLLISRHEGDVINGNAAAFMAQDKGLDVRPLLMYDDISSAPKGQEDERRGAAGTMFIYKILGAAAEAGLGLDDLMALGEAVRDATRTLGAALFPGTSPLSGETMFTLPPGEIAIGMGVHGERGAGHRQIAPARELVRDMVDALLADRPIAAGTETLVLINGSGGTTMMELLTIYGEVAGYLEEQGSRPIAHDRFVFDDPGNGRVLDLAVHANGRHGAILAGPHGAPLFPHLAGMGIDPWLIGSWSCR